MWAFATTLIGLIFAATPPARADESPPIFTDPLPIYGKEILFGIWRNGSHVGDHQITFAQDGDRLTVTTHMQIAIHLLFIAAYRFNYDSVEVWTKGRLVSLDVNENDDGRKYHIVAQPVGDGLQVTGGKQGTVMAPATALPTTHWNAAQPLAPVTIDTLDGVLRAGPANRLGEDGVVIPGEVVRASHYEYTGKLQGTEVWYAGLRWVQMHFKGRDGSLIEYRCVKCGASPH